jgi:hypothetical protein
MLNFRWSIKTMIVFILCSSLSACQKPAGPGGKASIRGKVYATDWDNTQRYVISRGYGVGERVNIIYGKGTVVGNDIRTGPDGSYEFRYLTKGHYRIYVNSLDTTILFKGNDTYHSIIQEVEISGTDDIKTLPDFKMNR